jgi:hypothetical protein
MSSEDRLVLLTAIQARIDSVTHAIARSRIAVKRTVAHVELIASDSGLPDQTPLS